jgi:PIN domain nuclease of toxin-antitoxin system
MSTEPEPGDRVLLDTHVLLWWHADSTRLSPTARSWIEQADRVLVSAITAWEVAMLVEKGTVTLDRPTQAWIRDVFSQDDVEAAELSPAAAVSAAQLPDFHGDPADRLLYATALAQNVALISKDRRLRDYATRHPGPAVVW